MSALLGKFKLVSSENFDEFMKATGVGMVMRKLGATSKPTVEISQDGDTWSIKTITTFKTSEIKFKLGEEFEETRMDGSVVKTVITLEDNKLIQKQFGDKEVVITRELDGEKLKVICTVDNIVSTRIYDKAE
ncbi:fatty acid-binding protein-like isoform X1 [Centruroides sculpturatus]|uniref:fatty acid-binding protein-like isoform X1 n=1 Tax=Centruroides sculpturatus TaxID=218467 RepID=UPI000C6CE4FF|nr:fatty acid-binding protein-like isoform X1 [Centruroides sculpturatus]